MRVLTIAIRLLEGPVSGGQWALLPASCSPMEARLVVISTVFLSVLLLVLTLTVLGRWSSSSAGNQWGAPSDQRLLGSATGSISSSAWRSATTLTVTCRGTDTAGHGGRAQSQTPGRQMTSLRSEGEVQPFL